LIDWVFQPGFIFICQLFGWRSLFRYGARYGARWCQSCIWPLH